MASHAMAFHVSNQSRRLRRRGERGQGMTEYALILVLIAVVVVVVVHVVGNQTANIFSNVSNGFAA